MSDHDNFIDFVKSIYQEDFTPLHEPRFGEEEKKYVLDTINSSFVSSVGEYVNEVENKIAQISKTPGAVAVVNGTSALQISLQLAGVTQGDEVITQALTFVATVNAISYNNAHPVFVDVDLDTMGMSPEALRRFLDTYAEKRAEGAYNTSTGRRIGACLPMHTFGFMCRIDEIISLCTEWNIPVVEDAAEAFGCAFKGKPSGSFGKMGAFSFNGNKIITAGGGGAIISADPELTARAKYITTTAKVPHQWDYVHDEIGYNFRMPNINAALLYAQLERMEQMRTSKESIYMEYSNFLANTNLSLKTVPPDTSWNYWLFSVELNDRSERDRFLESTNGQGVMTRPIWQLIYKLKMYAHCQRDDQENAQYLEDRIVNIPSSARKI